MKPRALHLALAAVAAALALLALGCLVGSDGLEPWRTVWSDPVALQIVRDIRLPRALGAWGAGALLGLAGAIAQGLFRNPLADPYLLGSASGAALGVAIALVVWGVSPLSAQWLTLLGLSGSAFGGAALGVVLTLVLARGVQNTLRLLLAGVVVGVVLASARELLLLARADLLIAMQSFMLGNTAWVGWQACALLLGGWGVCMVGAWAMSPVLDGLALGEATARSLGLALVPLRAGLIAVIALATGLAVAHTGLIGFVGLAAPHLVRGRVSTSHGRLLILSSLVGGALLLGADVLARWLLAPQELPVGILTAALGGSYLLWHMHRRGAGAGAGL